LRRTFETSSKREVTERLLKSGESSRRLLWRGTGNCKSDN